MCGINESDLPELAPRASQTTTAHAISTSPAIAGVLFKVPARSFVCSLFNKDTVVFFPTSPILITFPDH